MTVHDVARHGAHAPGCGIMQGMTARYQSTKVFQGFSTAFRQWRAEGTHCAFLHGYDVFFKVWFEGEPDSRHWVWDFGGMSRCRGTIDGMSPRAWMDHLLDHTVIAAEDDPELARLQELDRLGVLQLRVLPAVGAEAFARHLCERLDAFVREETSGRVRVVRVEFFENERNSAIYEP
ncbi:MAG: 6-carboxytetrahydropterin synthase [Candidatus Sericytochromatia bacterium]|nr:6-carboxytetrahydropterin synthase [Candidatus Sericytochromatia bacterium]